MQAYSISCDRCDYRSHPSAASGERRYRMPGGEEYHINSESVWCYYCDGITQAELLPIHPRQRIWQPEDSIWKRLCYFVDKSLIPSLPFSHSQIPLPEARTSPARCLKCGSTKHEPISLEPTTTAPNRHPGCGGTLQLAWEDVWFHSGYQLHYYDAEGHFLTTERPTPPWQTKGNRVQSLQPE
jgi:hypothetical protein